MDRPTLTRVSEYIIINIPALNWPTVKTAKELESNLLVGKTRLKQWFSADPSVLLF
jgi:hypothetical protein